MDEKKIGLPIFLRHSAQVGVFLDQCCYVVVWARRSGTVARVCFEYCDFWDRACRDSVHLRVFYKDMDVFPDLWGLSGLLEHRVRLRLVLGCVLTLGASGHPAASLASDYMICHCGIVAFGDRLSVPSPVRFGTLLL